MQFPESWLREFCNPPLTTSALAELLTMSGLEVEQMRPTAPPFTGVVVAEIVAVKPHPNADRLRVCDVDAGASSKNGPLQIVCGAPNARVGIRVPLAVDGAALPAGDDGQPLLIRSGMLRGVDSQGMLCSARELHLNDDHGGLLELAADAPLGTDLRDWLKLDDTLFTLKLTPNLAHCLSVYGVAREVAALTGAPLRAPSIAPAVVAHRQTLPVQIDAPDLCGRFSGRIVRNVDTRARTPDWMIDRLARCGQRPVSALVDISNYVMFELGRPSHIFDLDKIHDRLVVRWGRPGESLKLLNGSTVEVDAQVGVIADAQAVESLAGIMGGDATAVSDATRNVYVEAAFWWPHAIAGRSRRFNFTTDAGHRFERGVDPASTALHVERITQLIQQICGGDAGPLDDHVVALPPQAPVSLRVARASKVIGMPLDDAQCARVFERLGFAFEQTPGRFTVTPPSWRFDLQIEEDLIEEVIRIIGYDKLPATAPLAPVLPRVRSETQRGAFDVRHALAALDYQETINFGFVEARWEHELAGNADPIRVLNPIAAPLSVMRSSLLGSLVQVLRHNVARKTNRVRVFEISRVAMRDATAAAGDATVAGAHQPARVAALAYGAADTLQWGVRERPVDFFDVKGDIEALLAPLKLRFERVDHPALHPGRSARVIIDGQDAGLVGELHPRWRQGYELPHAPVVFELDLDLVLRRRLPVFEPIARHQPAWRDLALVVHESKSHDALTAALGDDPLGLVTRVTLFDVYKPTVQGSDMAPGEHSMAVRIELLDREATLTEDRIDAAVTAAVARAATVVGARLRG
jgi:phenylalanyl-tRNA synthetase beta chain